MTKILIIENDFLIRKLLKKMLTRNNYEVVEASNGQEGLSMLYRCSPSLILCDWDLPILSGLAICKKVKSDPELSSIYFIFLTTNSTLGQRVKGLDSGADDFLKKPISMSELSARVRVGLRVNRELQEQRRLTQTLEAEMTEAADYIRSLMPSPMIGSVSIESQFLPSRQLGGDCFDYRWLDRDWLLIYVLDVSGHGLGAALMSVSVQNILRTQVLPDVNFYQPKMVLTALNEAFAAQESERYFTMWYGVYDSKRRLLFYSSAGHPPGLLISGDVADPEVQRLRTPATPIGIVLDMNYTTQCCKIPPNSTLYLFSDGIYEFQKFDQTMWTLEDWVRFLRIHHTQTPLTPEEIVRKVQVIKKNLEFEDDCTLLQVRFK